MTDPHSVQKDYSSTTVPFCSKDNSTWQCGLLLGASLTSLCSVSCIGVAFSSWAYFSVCGNSLGCFEISIRPLWQTTQLIVIQSWYWKPRLMTRDGHLELHLSHFPSTLPLKCPLILAVSPEIGSLNPVFPPHLTLSDPLLSAHL